MTEHTPDLAVYDIDKDEEGCARFHVNTNVPFDPAEAEAIPRLIEAAPDLLAALEGIMPLAQTGFSAMARSEQGKESQGVLRQARAAIAKATEGTN